MSSLKKTWKIIKFFLGALLLAIIGVCVIIWAKRNDHVNGRLFGVEYTLSADQKSYILTEYGVPFNFEKTFVVPSSYNGKPVSEIGPYAFYWCGGLRNVIISDSITSIGDHAFDECLNIESITIGKNVTNIWDQAFCDCLDLKYVIIPKSVTFIGEDAFLCGNALTRYYYAGTEDDWDKINIKDPSNEFIDTFRGVIYYYSEEQPEKAGNYWHYDAKGEIAVWGEQ